jgi:hypothetical protein
MIKKVFVGVVLAVIFIMLVLGAVNRTLAKVNDRTPLSLEEKTLENKSEKQNINQNLRLDKNTSRSDDSSVGANSDQRRQGNQVYGSNSDGAFIEHNVNPADWVDLSGIIEEMGVDLWIIRLLDGSQIEIEGRPLSFLIEQGFNASPSDQISMRGFFEDDHFKVGHIVNQNTGQEIELRNEAGQPMWSGDGWRNN